MVYLIVFPFEGSFFFLRFTLKELTALFSGEKNVGCSTSCSTA